jgi:processive 1,2-diacylglycerol beta-glucosyltransferase
MTDLPRAAGPIRTLRPARRALILSGSIGKGHDVVAEACASALSTAGCSSNIVDCMALLGERANQFADKLFRGMLAVPGAYDAFHYSQLRTGSRLASVMDRAAARRLAPVLGRMLDREPADLVLSVFATGGAAADALKAEGRDIRSVVYCTDACPHRLWVHPGTDLFLVTDEMSAAFIRYHRPDAAVAVVPAAARAEFHHPPSRPEARAELGLADDVPVALAMAGSWGVAPLDVIARALSQRGFRVLAVAGTNQRLHRRLQHLERSDPGVMAFGYSDRIPDLMVASDIVVTTPGDTCTEARLLDRPILLLDTVPGHGRENLQLELARGSAAATAGQPAIVAEAAWRLYQREGASASVRPPSRSGDAWGRNFLASLGSLGPVGGESRPAEAADGSHP